MELLSRITKHAEQIASHRTNASKLTRKITNKKLPIYLNSHELSLVVFTNNIAFYSNRIRDIFVFVNLKLTPSLI